MFNKVLAEKRINAKIKNFNTELKQVVSDIQKYPTFSYYISSDVDTKLILKELSNKNMFLLTQINSNKDVGGNYIEFSWQINNYNSLSELIYLLESIKNSFPICYESYQISGKVVTIKGRFYYEIG